MLDCCRSKSRVLATLKDFFKPVPSSSSGGLQHAAMSYGVMVIDMGVHELGGLEKSLNLIQVRFTTI